MSNFVYPPFKCCVKNRILPLKWYIPLKKKTKHLIMYFYVVLSRFFFNCNPPKTNVKNCLPPPKSCVKKCIPPRDTAFKKVG